MVLALSSQEHVSAASLPVGRLRPVDLIEGSEIAVGAELTSVPVLAEVLALPLLVLRVVVLEQPPVVGALSVGLRVALMVGEEAALLLFAKVGGTSCAIQILRRPLEYLEDITLVAVSLVWRGMSLGIDRGQVVEHGGRSCCMLLTEASPTAAVAIASARSPCAHSRRRSSRVPQSAPGLKVVDVASLRPLHRATHLPDHQTGLLPLLLKSQIIVLLLFFEAEDLLPQEVDRRRGLADITRMRRRGRLLAPRLEVELVEGEVLLTEDCVGACLVLVTAPTLRWANDSLEVPEVLLRPVSCFSKQPRYHLNSTELAIQQVLEPGLRV